MPKLSPQVKDRLTTGFAIAALAGIAFGWPHIMRHGKSALVSVGMMAPEAVGEGIHNKKTDVGYYCIIDPITPKIFWYIEPGTARQLTSTNAKDFIRDPKKVFDAASFARQLYDGFGPDDSFNFLAKVDQHIVDLGLQASLAGEVEQARSIISSTPVKVTPLWGMFMRSDSHELKTIFFVINNDKKVYIISSTKEQPPGSTDFSDFENITMEKLRDYLELQSQRPEQKAIIKNSLNIFHNKMREHGVDPVLIDEIEKYTKPYASLGLWDATPGIKFTLSNHPAFRHHGRC